jgi:hypothetical protein
MSVSIDPEDLSPVAQRCIRQAKRLAISKNGPELFSTVAECLSAISLQHATLRALNEHIYETQFHELDHTTRNILAGSIAGLTKDLSMLSMIMSVFGSISGDYDAPEPETINDAFNSLMRDLGHEEMVEE